MKTPSIYIVGIESQAGSYLLRIRLTKRTKLKFGRFKKGKLITLPPGDYIYVGSALSEKGSTSLARRLIRHATRTENKPPHTIRKEMLKQFKINNLGVGDLLPKNGKTLFWNIDHFLDLEFAEIINILAIRSPIRLESKIAEFLERTEGTEIFEKSLGANDSPRHTHILRVNADELWWKSIIKKIQSNYFPLTNPIENKD